MSLKGKTELLENPATITWLQLLKLPLHLQNYWQLQDRTKPVFWELEATEMGRKEHGYDRESQSMCGGQQR